MDVSTKNPNEPELFVFIEVAVHVHNVDFRGDLVLVELLLEIRENCVRSVARTHENTNTLVVVVLNKGDDGVEPLGVLGGARERHFDVPLLKFVHRRPQYAVVGEIDHRHVRGKRHIFLRHRPRGEDKFGGLRGRNPPEHAQKQALL